MGAWGVGLGWKHDCGEGLGWEREGGWSTMVAVVATLRTRHARTVYNE